jgi:2-dehydro-3-deoxygluconokinase
MNNIHPRVVTLGETMLMFAPPQHELLETTGTFRAYIGGSEANTAIGLERLGIHSAWIGKLPDHPLGKRIRNDIQALGVDVSGVVWGGSNRLGIFFVEWGAEPRPTYTIYDRANSAAATLKSWEVNWQIIENAEWLHMTGISPALSTNCRISTLEIASKAKQLGIKFSFDLNFRSLLWQAREARESWHEILPLANIIISTEEDAAILCSETLPRKDYLKRIYNEYRPDAVILTCGKDGSTAFNGQRLITMNTWPVKVVNRLGAGDAFNAGFLYGYITESLHKGLAYGNAMAVLKMTIPENMPLVNRADVDKLVSGELSQLKR